MKGLSGYLEPPHDPMEEWMEEVFLEIDEDTWEDSEEWFLGPEPRLVLFRMYENDIKPSVSAYILKGIHIMTKKRGD